MCVTFFGNMKYASKNFNTVMFVQVRHCYCIPLFGKHYIQITHFSMNIFLLDDVLNKCMVMWTGLKMSRL